MHFCHRYLPHGVKRSKVSYPYFRRNISAASQTISYFGYPSNQYFSASARPANQGHVSRSLVEHSPWPTAQVSEQHRF